MSANNVISLPSGKLTASQTLDSVGATVASGLNIQSGSLTISAGGLNVPTGDLKLLAGTASISVASATANALVITAPTGLTKDVVQGRITGTVTGTANAINLSNQGVSVFSVCIALRVFVS